MLLYSDMIYLEFSVITLNVNAMLRCGKEVIGKASSQSIAH